jgi:hypothetical protein
MDMGIICINMRVWRIILKGTREIWTYLDVMNKIKSGNLLILCRVIPTRERIDPSRWLGRSLARKLAAAVAPRRLGEERRKSC